MLNLQKNKFGTMDIKNLLSYLILFLSFCMYSQDMKTGFTYLETGKYEEAEVFFKEVLNSYPTNKTARLCYGRAIGFKRKI